MNTPKLRFKEFSGAWEVKKLGDICEFQQGVQIDLEFHIKNEKEGYARFLRIENYTQNSNDFRFIPIELSNGKFIKFDDIIVVRYGATAGFISKGYDGVLANNLFKVTPDEKKLTKNYLFAYLKSEKVFNFFQSAMSGGAMPALSFKIVGALDLPFPTIPEQTKIANFLTAIDEKIAQLSQTAQLLTDYKKGVMQQIFSQ
jgi:type I restriction enzyme S subunit